MHVHQWLRKYEVDFEVPEVHCELLLSPTAEEVASDKELFDSAHYKPATYANFSSAALQWQQASSQDEDNIAYFFFVGHGLYDSSSDRQLLLLQDYLAPNAHAWAHCFTVEDFHRAMARRTDTVRARRQFYFVDACQTVINGPDFSRLGLPTHNVVLNSVLPPLLPREAPIFCATIPGHSTYGIRGDMSLYTKALLQHLKNDAADYRLRPDNTGLDWEVTTSSLQEKLVDTFSGPEGLSSRAFSSSSSEQPFPCLKGTQFDPRSPICRVMSPYVDVTINLYPEVARNNQTSIEFTDEYPPNERYSLPQASFQGRIPAGQHTLDVQSSHLGFVPARQNSQMVKGGRWAKTIHLRREGSSR